MILFDKFTAPVLPPDQDSEGSIDGCLRVGSGVGNEILLATFRTGSVTYTKTATVKKTGSEITVEEFAITRK
jgi:hypothetical protein